VLTKWPPTETAAKAILRASKTWLIALKKRLLDIADFSNPSSALGEIRCYGALLETGMAVNAKPTLQEIIPADNAVLDEPLAGFGHLLVFFFRLEEFLRVAH
jgi:hypothetical protein